MDSNLLPTMGHIKKTIWVYVMLTEILKETVYFHIV